MNELQHLYLKLQKFEIILTKTSKVINLYGRQSNIEKGGKALNIKSVTCNFGSQRHIFLKRKFSIEDSSDHRYQIE